MHSRIHHFFILFLAAFTLFARGTAVVEKRQDSPVLTIIPNLEAQVAVVLQSLSQLSSNTDITQFLDSIINIFTATTTQLQAQPATTLSFSDTFTLAQDIATIINAGAEDVARFKQTPTEKVAFDQLTVAVIPVFLDVVSTVVVGIGPLITEMLSGQQF